MKRRQNVIQCSELHIKIVQKMFFLTSVQKYNLISAEILLSGNNAFRDSCAGPFLGFVQKYIFLINIHLWIVFNNQTIMCIWCFGIWANYVFLYFTILGWIISFLAVVGLGELSTLQSITPGIFRIQCCHSGLLWTKLPKCIFVAAKWNLVHFMRALMAGFMSI